MQSLDLTGFKAEQAAPFPIVNGDWASGPDGGTIDFTNYYMTVSGKPYYGVCGECHYSRLDPSRWDEQLAKIASGGVNVVSTYVFWNHHEEREGIWDFTGRRNLRRFVQLCKRHGLKVIVRIGPFDHGEVRNGGMPDWLYGKPYEVRSCDQGFLDQVRDLYHHIAQQLDGLYFKDGGPIIAVQLDNEYMHSSAPWAITEGTTAEWMPGGHDGQKYLDALRSIAEDEGISAPFYTATGWGNSPVPDDVLPLWGGYAYRPWLFYGGRGEHPVTDEYIYRNYHADDCPRGEEFSPSYAPHVKPYACCELGGGMFNSYNYRFSLPLKSVDAMANVKMGSGCNVLGYYMYQGGSNPIGDGVYLNEGETPKISYDFQAALGEFGQMRESYRRLKVLHYFSAAFGDDFTPFGVALPPHQAAIDPSDVSTLRWSVRTDGVRGFVFINNFQDHMALRDQHGQSIEIKLSDGSGVRFDGLGLAAGENCILPFNMDMDGVLLKAATVQPVTVLQRPGASYRTFVFMRPEGMDDCWMEFADGSVRHISAESSFEHFNRTSKLGKVEIVIMSRALADSMTQVNGEALVFAHSNPTQTDVGVRMDDISLSGDAPAAYVNCGMVAVESTGNEIGLTTYPEGFVDRQSVVYPQAHLDAVVTKMSSTRYCIDLPDDCFDHEGVKDVRLKIRYQGDVGWLWVGSTLIDDNFVNGDTWEVGLKEYVALLHDNRNRLVLTISPIRKGASVQVDSAMAARMESSESEMAALYSVDVQPVYEADFKIAQ